MRLIQAARALVQRADGLYEPDRRARCAGDRRKIALLGIFVAPGNIQDQGRMQVVDDRKTGDVPQLGKGLQCIVMAALPSLCPGGKQGHHEGVASTRSGCAQHSLGPVKGALTQLADNED